MRLWSGRFVPLAASAFIGFAVQPAVAQKAAGGSTAPSRATGAPTPMSGTTFPAANNAATTTPIPIMLSGNVMFDDGTQPNANIRIERVCNTGTARLEAHTDSKGRFSFQLGQNAAVDADAEDSGTPGLLNPGAGPLSSSSGRVGPLTGGSNPLANCELRARYAGYRSDRVQLAGRKPLDDPNIGTIVLHRLMNVLGSTLTVTTALAPKQAAKDYEKGEQLAAKGNFPGAEKRFLDATHLYSKYAIAWYALGGIQQREGRADNARQSFKAAIAADDKYVSPYGQLALLSVQEGRWEDAANYTRRMIQLNPIEFPGAFWLNALANFKLNKPEDAERSAKQLLQLDSAHKYPQGESLLGELLFDKGNYAEATPHLRAYLVLRPNASETTHVKEMLAKIEQAGTEAKKQEPVSQLHTAHP